MPLVASFSASQSLAEPSQITLTDDTTGSDASITSRRIYILLANGNWLDENGDEQESETYITWPYADSTTTLDILPGSTAASITVGWYAVTTRVYVDDDAFCFNLHDYLAALQILQGNTSSPDQIQDTAYYNNLMQFIVNLFNEENAIEFGGDLFSSQGAMNRNQQFIDKEAYYF
jgi:hypothetical protein